MDGGAWWAAVHGVAKSRTRLSDFTFTFHVHALEKEMATHSSVLAWRIPGTGEPGGLPSMGSHRVGYNWSDLAAAAAIYDYALFTSGLETWTDTTENISVKSNSQIIHIGKGNLVCTGSKGQHDSDDRLTEFSSVQSLSRVQLFATPWITACQASLSITNSAP